MNQASFRSKHYPSSRRTAWVVQQYAQKYYQVFAVFILLTTLLILLNHHNPFYFALITSSIAIVLANFLALMRMHALVAEIYFVEGQFYVLTVYDVLKGGKIPSFPVHFAHFSSNSQGATIHYHDAILQLTAQDWPEWQLLSQWFLQQTLETNPAFHYEN